jgi:large subunit ribosomal protein L24
MNTLHGKKGDTVIVLSGNEKGKTGKVIEVFPKTGVVVVEGVGIHKKHQKPRRDGERGQIIEKQHAIRVSKVMTVELHKERAAKRKKK